MTKTVPNITDRAARIADNLNHLRKAADESVETLSIVTGIPKRTLDRKFTTSPETFTLRELALIADALGVDIFDAFEVAS